MPRRLARRAWNLAVSLPGDVSSLRLSFAMLRVLARAAPRDRRTLDWARRTLGLEGAALDDWYRRAWWGQTAAVRAKLRLAQPGGFDEVGRLVEPVDWAPLDALRAHGGGVILVGGHVGPYWVVRWLVERRHPDGLLIATEEESEAREGAAVHGVSDDRGRATALAAAARALRDGKVVMIMADGRVWGRTVERPFMGGVVRLSPGGAALARVTGAPALTMGASWHGERVRVRFGEPIRPASSPRDAFESEWLSSYLAWLEGWLRGPPENLRLTEGLLTRQDRGGLL